MNPAPVHDTPGTADATASEWTRRRERGSPALMRFMAWVSLALGRAPARVLLHLIAAYFLAFSARARRSSRDFLARALGRPASLADRYRHFLAFASTIHDRVFFIADRFEPFDIRVHGAETIENLPPGAGAFLMGAHLGSFEVVRACGRAQAGRRIAMAMVEENARKLNAALSAINPRAAEGIVALGHLDSMLKLGNLLDEGALVGVLADRSPGHEPAFALPFLGDPASFPTGPMRMAAILKSRVIFMTGLYLGANRYDIHFETLADFSAPGPVERAERDRLVREAVACYASRLEHYARKHPFNWFNFHDFWAMHDAP
jgi:predicted LPLAT superfamily acyltransferase